MDSTFPKSFASASSSASLETSIWSRLIEVISSFDCAITKDYVAACIAIVEKIMSKEQPLIIGTDLIAAIQTELPIPTSAIELAPAGLLGVCINLITIVQPTEEDPIECILSALIDGGFDFICFPGAYDREA
jgi:hypothetical protein